MLFWFAESPIFEIRPQNVSTIAGATIGFGCVAKGEPPPKITWRKLHGDLPRDRIKSWQGKSLQLKNVAFSDSGIYVCEARNEAGYAKASGSLKVVAAPSVLEKPENVLSLQGKDLNLKCQIEADPDPLLIWKLPFHSKNSLLMKRQRKGNKVFISPDGTTLKLKKTSVEDSGTYQCWGISTGGGIASSAEVLVVDAFPPPMIGVLPKDQEAVPGSSVTFPCQAASEKSVPSITWWFKEEVHLEAKKIVPVENSVIILESGALVLKNVYFNNSGIYTCKVTSSSGNVEHDAILKVRVNSRPLNNFLSLPAPPSKPTIQIVNKTSVSLIWSPHSKMSSNTEESYSVYYWTYPWDEWRLILADIRRTSAVITNLVSNSAYVFLVKAVNQNGESFPSPWSNFLHLNVAISEDDSFTTEEKKHIRRNLNKPFVILTSAEISSLYPDSVILTWDVLDSSEMKVDGIIIYTVDDNNAIESSTVLGISSPSYTVKHLKPTTKYTFFLVPFWRTLEGVPSNAKVITTPEQGK